MNKVEYLKLKQDLVSLHRRQWDKKRQLKKVNAYIGSLQSRMHHNKVQSPEGHPGATYVPVKVVEPLHRSYKSLSNIQKDLNKGRKSIKDLEQKIIIEKARRMVHQALDRAFKSQKPATNRDYIKHVLKFQGLYLHDNNEISNINGKLIGWYGNDAKYNGNELTWTFKPIQALEFISIDINIDIDGLRVAK